MSRRQNFIDTMNHKRPENMIIDFGGNPLSTMEGKSENYLLDFLGYKKEKPEERLLFGKTPRLDERILKHFDVDTRSVGTILTPRDSQFCKISDDEYIDEWGIRRVFTGLYWEAVNTPLKDAEIGDLDSYPFPDPESISGEELDQIEQEAKALYEDTDYVICAEHPVYGIFELGCWMCGFDEFLYRIAAEPEFVEKFFEKVLDYQKKVLKQYYGRIGKYIHYTSSGDDYATQNAPFVSPGMFRDYIKPYFQERIRYTKELTDAYYLHHSCGSVYMLLDDLIDSGVEILNPIQPKAKDMGPDRLKSEFGNRIVFHGGIDTQELLPFLDEQRIRVEVAKTIDIMIQDGGYIFAAAHNIQEDVAPEKLTVMLETARKAGKR